MDDMSRCINCRHATWQRTPTGRVSGKLPGRCGWTATVAVPVAYWNDHVIQTLDLKIKGAIWLDEGHGCPTFEPPQSNT